MFTDDSDVERDAMFAGLCTTRAIRRYQSEPIPKEDLNRILFAATRAPSGSNRQPFRFLILDESVEGLEARLVLGEAARRYWAAKFLRDQYDQRSGLHVESPKSRLAKTMQEYVDNFENSPVVILPCLAQNRVPLFGDGASIYPACQNLLLAARALGYGGVMTGTNWEVDEQLHSILAIPADVIIAATITLGRPRGKHGPVRRRPLTELIFEGSWGRPSELGQ